LPNIDEHDPGYVGYNCGHRSRFLAHPRPGMSALST
jgi:hypothetical protein